MATIDHGVVLELLTTRAKGAEEAGFSLLAFGDPEPSNLESGYRVSGLSLEHVPYDGPIDHPDEAVAVLTIDVAASGSAGAYSVCELAGKVVAVLRTSPALAHDPTTHLATFRGLSVSYRTHEDENRTILLASIESRWNVQRTTGDDVKEH